MKLVCYNRFMDITKHELHWFAGLFEGEGTFVFYKNTPKRIAIQMTDLDTLEKVQEIWGGRIYHCKKLKDHHKDSWQWVAGGELARQIAIMIEPLLMSRRKARCQEFILGINTRYQVSTKVNQRVAKARELRSTGLTHQEIADILGVERSAVSHYLSKRYAHR